MLSPLSGASFVGKTGTTFHWRGPAGPHDALERV